jgi:acyl-CoA thioesterase-1
MIKKTLQHLLLWAALMPLLAKEILILGDSLSDGFGLSQPKPWPSYMQESGWEILNISNAGATLQEGYQKLQSYFKTSTSKPTYLLIALGSNDGLRAYPISTIDHGLQQLIDLANDHHIQPLLIGWRLPPNYGPYAQLFEQVFATVAQRNHIFFIPCPLESIAEDFSYFQEDAYHPNDKAQPVIAEKLCQSLSLLT